MRIRIEALADMIPPGSALADIGTDHAYLPILACQKQIVTKAYACDIAKGPLMQAENNIRQKGLEKQIETILSDGLKEVPSDADCAVIAGMGVRTAIGILEAAMARLETFRRIIVQVNDDVPALRKWISERRYYIDTETTVFEKGKYYTAIAFHTADHDPLTSQEIYTGILETISDLPSARDYWYYRINKIRRNISLGANAENYQNELDALEGAIEKGGQY